MRRYLAVLSVVAVGSLACAGVGAHASSPRIGRATAERIGIDAYVYGIPLMEFLRTAREQTSLTVPDGRGNAPLNQLGSARQLANVHEQVIVQPNTDTLYTMAHLDLGSGPLVLHVPAVPNGRYYSFEFIDPYTNVFAYVGTRTTGDGAGNFVVTGPGFRGRLPRGLRLIRSRYRRVWLVGRTLVYGPRDLAEVHRIQAGYRLIPLAQFIARGLAWRPSRPRHRISKPRKFSEPTGLRFFDALGTALAANPPPARDAAILRELRRVGIGPGLHPSREHLSAAIRAGLAAAANAGPAYVENLRVTIATRSVIAHDGWFVPPPDTGDYGTDYAFRAVVALNGLAANRPAEAMYIVGVRDQALQPLDGANTYRIHFPAGQQPPARYFWSLTMYNDRFFLSSNPIGRYEIGDRTPGLSFNPDGSLDIYIQNSPPSGHESNWLPAPPGVFEVTLRLYGPLPSALQGSYRYPPIIRTG